MDHLCYLCLVLVNIICFCARLFIDALWCGHLLGRTDLLALVCDV